MSNSKEISKGVDAVEINKNSFKVLKYISSGTGSVPYEKAITKFSKQINPPISETINWLNCQDLINIEHSGTNENGFETHPYALTMTMEGKNTVEERLSRNNSDTFARATAIVAILLSLASIVISVVLRK